MSGHAAAEPTTVMKSRRLIVAPEAQTRNGSNRHWCSGRVDVSPTDVRFGSKADMCGAKRHVRFTPNSDRESGPRGEGHVCFTPPKSGHVRCKHRCPLRAN